MIVVIDYSMGNLHSVHKALQHVTNDKVVITADADEIKQIALSFLVKVQRVIA